MMNAFDVRVPEWQRRGAVRTVSSPRARGDAWGRERFSRHRAAANAVGMRGCSMPASRSSPSMRSTPCSSESPTPRAGSLAPVPPPKPIRTGDITHHPGRHGFPARHPRMKSFLGVPIAGRGRVFGNLYLTEKMGAAEFDAEDERIAVLLARQAALAVENARLSQQSQQLIDQVGTMQRERELFFATMNHELRNSLTGVFGWAERLVRLRPTGDAVAQAAQEVYECAEQTVTLLNNFLDLTRLHAGKVRPVWRDVDVQATVGRVLENQR